MINVIIECDCIVTVLEVKSILSVLLIGDTHNVRDMKTFDTYTSGKL